MAFTLNPEFSPSPVRYLYYGFRYYSTGLGRWINRDPIEEQGGENLYAFIYNEPLGNYDMLGLEESVEGYFKVLIVPSSKNDVKITEIVNKKRCGDTVTRIKIQDIYRCEKCPTDSCYVPQVQIRVNINYELRKNMGSSLRSRVIEHEDEHFDAYKGQFEELKEEWHPFFKDQRFTTQKECRAWLRIHERQYKRTVVGFTTAGTSHLSPHPGEFIGCPKIK